MRFGNLVGLFVVVVMAAGCASIMERAGYEPTHEPTQVAREVPQQRPATRRYYDEEIRKPGAFANFEPRSADGSGIVRVNLAHCKIGTTDDGILSYNCVKPKPEPAAEAEPAAE